MYEGERPVHARTTGMQNGTLLLPPPSAAEKSCDERSRRDTSLRRRVEEERLGGNAGRAAVAFFVRIDVVESPAPLAHHCADKCQLRYWRRRRRRTH